MNAQKLQRYGRDEIWQLDVYFSERSRKPASRYSQFIANGKMHTKKSVPAAPSQCLTKHIISQTTFPGRAPRLLWTRRVVAFSSPVLVRWGLGFGVRQRSVWELGQRGLQCPETVSSPNNVLTLPGAISKLNGLLPAIALVN